MKPRQTIELRTSKEKPKPSRKSARSKPITHKVELVHVPLSDAEDRPARAYAIIFQAAVHEKPRAVFTEQFDSPPSPLNVTQ